MPRRHAAVTLAAMTLLAGGCTAQTTSTTQDFQGQEKEVAQVVADLQSAGQKKDAERICSDIFSRTLVDQLKSGGTDCVTEMDDAISDSDDFKLEVRDVTVTGNTARAQVQQGKDGPTATFEFAREAGGWRATSLGAS